MELLQLRYFCDAAETQSFTVTAAKFLVPASNISQRIRTLEKELGVPLFIRHANRVTLAPAGEAFYKKASAALALLNSATAEIQGGGEVLRVCVNCNRQIAILALERLKRKRPDVTLRVAFVENPLAEPYDIILSLEDARLADMYARPLCTEQMVLAVSKNNPLAQAKELDTTLLAAQSFLTFREKSGLRAMTDRVCADFGFQPNIVLETDDPNHLRKCVELDIGVAIGSLLAWEGARSDQVVLKPLAGYFRKSVLYLPNGEPRGAVTDFLDCIFSLEQIKALQ